MWPLYFKSRTHSIEGEIDCRNYKSMRTTRASRGAEQCTPLLSSAQPSANLPLNKRRKQRSTCNPPPPDPLIGMFPKSVWGSIVGHMDDRSVLLMGAVSSEMQAVCSDRATHLVICVNRETSTDRLPQPGRLARRVKLESVVLIVKRGTPLHISVEFFHYLTSQRTVRSISLRADNTSIEEMATVLQMSPLSRLLSSLTMTQVSFLWSR